MDQLSKIRVSVYRNVGDSSSQETISLLRWLQGFDRLNPIVDKIRNESCKDKRNELKRNLPGITASGLFSERKDDQLIQHSGFIALDFDGLSDPQETKRFLAGIDNVFYAGLSVSGRGVWALIPIMQPHHHQRHFKALEADFKGLGMLIDSKCGNVSRLRFYSYDPDAVFNMEAVVYEKLAPIQHTTKKRFEPYRDNENKGLENLIRKIEETGTDITTNYDDWLKLAGALASIYGENGRELFHRISRFYPGYKSKKADKQFSACLRNSPGFGEGIIFSIAKKYNLLLKN